MNAKTIQPDSCRDFIVKVLDKLQVPKPLADRWAELLVETSLLGIDSHGVRMLERYIQHIEGGGIRALAEPQIVTSSGGCVSLDACYALGHIAADRATSIAIERAKEHGISCVAVKNCNHVGACSLYTRRAALKNCVSLCTTMGRPTIAPWGGKKPAFGSNPLAVGAPIEGKGPFLFDAASATVAMGKITKAYDQQKPIPENWALDKQGRPTTNPAEAIVGSLLPVGGHKGYGLAMSVEILSAMLSGGLLSTGVQSWIQQTEKPCLASFTIIALDIGAFQNVVSFKHRMRQWVESLTASPKRPGFDRIYYPGQMEAESCDYRSTHGIPISDDDCEMFGRLAARFNIVKPEWAPLSR